MYLLLISRKLTFKILKMTKQLYLYSTSHCHLCELAYALILQVADPSNVNIIEIADDKVLLENYGLRIPVLKRVDTNAELNWPFNLVDITVFLNQSFITANKKASN